MQADKGIDIERHTLIYIIIYNKRLRHRHTDIDTDAYAGIGIDLAGENNTCLHNDCIITSNFWLKKMHSK